MNRHKLLIALCLLVTVCQAQTTDQPARVSTINNSGEDRIISVKLEEQLSSILTIDVSELPNDFPIKSQDQSADQYRSVVASYARINPSLFTRGYLEEIGYAPERVTELPQYHTHARINTEWVTEKLADENVKITFEVKPFGINQAQLLSVVSQMDGVKDAQILLGNDGFYLLSFVMNRQQAKTVNVKVLQNLNCSEFFLNGQKSSLSEVKNAVLKVEKDKK